MAEQTLAAVHSTATVTTEHASRYLQQLCKHFAHKRPVTFDPQQGQIAFSAGICNLKADGTQLMLSLESPDEEHLAQLIDVVVRHLVRFAFREELKIDWRPA